jgi:hypothetical protein
MDAVTVVPVVVDFLVTPRYSPEWPGVVVTPLSCAVSVCVSLKNARGDRLQPVVVRSSTGGYCIGRAPIDDIENVSDIFGRTFQKVKIMSPDSARNATSNMFVKGKLLASYEVSGLRLQKNAEITVMSIGVKQDGASPKLVGHCKVRDAQGKWIQWDNVPMELIETIPPAEGM